MNNLNSIQGNGASSWAQFVKLKQAARERNSGFSVDGAAKAVRSEKAAPRKSGADVYSEHRTMVNKTNLDVIIKSEEKQTVKGNNFDAYA